jgi:hypothetical protein
MSINSLEKYISNRLTNHLMRTGLMLIVFDNNAIMEIFAMIEVAV